MTMVEIAGVCAGYGATHVLHGLDLTVEKGTTTAILGPSGSGKTTLLRVIAGFERATAGTVSIAGRLVDGPKTHLAPEKRQLGYVAQDGALFPHLTVARNVAFGLRRSPTRENRVSELLRLVGLGEFAERYPHQLSGGQQQRVALARALAIDPPVILLDEPFAALDAALRADVRRDITRILRTAGATTILVTHDQDEALSLADEVAVLRNGRIAQSGTPIELYQRPVDPELAQFLGAANVLPAVAEAWGLRTAMGLHEQYAPGLPPDKAASALLRPEQIDIVTGRDASRTPATIESVEFHGHEALVALRAHTGSGDVPVLARTRLDPDFRVGLDVSISVTGIVHCWAD